MFKKNKKKKLTGGWLSAKVVVHTVNVNTKHKTQMRTKTLLIAAAAALAAGVVSSQAQVYSQNVVGYVNTPTANGGTYLIEVPFQVGVSNGLNEVFPLSNGSPTLPDYSSVLIWSPSTLSYTTYVSDSSSPTLWDDYTFTPLTYDPKVPVGQGFFLIPSASVTNTFVGTVAVPVGATNSTTYANGGTYLVSPVVPYGGYITNGTAAGGGIALDSNNGLPDYSSILIWNPGTLSYATYVSDSTSPSLWDDYTFTPLPAPPSVPVGQGFFLIPSGAFTWTEGLSAQ